MQMAMMQQQRQQTATMIALCGEASAKTILRKYKAFLIVLLIYLST